MKRTLDKKLFFSMTLDFLDVYIPQDSPSAKTVKTYRDGLTVFRRYVCDEKHLSIPCFFHRFPKNRHTELADRMPRSHFTQTGTKGTS